MNQISVINSNNQLVNSAFESLIDNSDLSFICKKISKMSTVLCLISSHLNYADNLKVSIRKISDKCLDISSEILRISSRKGFNFGSADYYCVLKDSVSTSVEISTVLASLLVANQISEQNYRVVINEAGIILRKSQAFISEYCRENNSVFSRHAFDVGSSLQTDISNKGQGNVLYRSYSSVRPVTVNSPESQSHKGHNNFNINNVQSEVAGSQNTQSKNDLKVIKAGKEVVKPEMNRENLSSQGSSRQVRILNLLKIESNLTVKDFTRVINDCSEKTIQRELLNLVAAGTLKKEGERRWSRYSLS